MEVTFTGAAVTKGSLAFGIRIEYAEGGPIRFARVVVPDDALDWQSIATFMAWLDRQVRRHMDRERELDDPLDLGL